MSRVLIVQASRTEAQMSALVVQATGHDAETAAGAAAALARLRAGGVDAVIADGMEGDGLARAGVPVILLGAASPGAARTAAAVLEKPVDPDALEAALRAALADRGALVAPARRSRVLAVDDSATYLETLVAFLEDDGHEVVAVASGDSALARFAADRAFDAVLLDLVMPGLSGQETCQRLRAAEGGRDVPVIVLTGREDKDTMVQVIELGADDYISKSADIEVLRVRLRAQLRRRHVEEARRRAEAESSHKSTFLANMSHEIRTPMNAVIGMTSLLLETPLTAEQRDYVETIRASGDHLLVIINDILDFSKVEAGLLVIEKFPFDLASCIEESLELVAPAAREKDVEVAYVLEPDVPRGVSGDMGRLRQILLNLLGNAVKFTIRGEVVVSVSARRLEDRRLEARFAVRDTGIGIPAHRIEKLFLPFSQVDASTTRVHGGTGLGLAISKRLCELMGGAISVESTPGVGSTFAFTIVLDEAPAPVADVTTALAGLGGRRVLLVDDNATNLRILATQLASWGLEAAGTCSPEEALSWAARGERFDAAVVDYRMPVMDGMTVIRELRKHDPDLRVILVSSYGRPVESVAAPEIAAFLTKPLRRSVLLGALAAVLEGRPVLSRPAPASRLDPDMAARAPLRVLVAEDNPVNQKVAAAMLGKLGYRADLVGSGREAIEAVKRQRYDVVFMDVHMPDLDGVDATRAIVQLLPRTERPRIVAMTAAVLEEERRRCAEAGMDDYITKPVTPPKLVAALLRVAEGRRERVTPLPGSVTASAAPADDAAPIDATVVADLRAAVGPAFAGIVDGFGDDSERLVRELRAAVAAQDGAAVHGAAHQLKATVGTFGAARLAQLAAELERLGKKGELAPAPAALAAFEAELGAVREALRVERDRQG